MLKRLKILALSIFVFSVFSNLSAQKILNFEGKKFQPNYKSLSQWKVPQWFENAVLGIYMHWGVYSVPGFVFTDPSERVDSGLWYGAQMYNKNNVYGVYQYHLKTYGNPCQFGYKDFIPMFTADKWNPDKWAKLFREAGADFAGLAAEHGDGFCLWDTKFDKFNVANMGPRRDVMGDLFQAVRKYGMRTVATFHKGTGTIYIYGRELCPEGVDVNNEEYADLYGPTSATELFNKLIEVIDKYQPDQMWFEAGAPEVYGEENYKKFMAYYYNKAEEWNKEVMVTFKEESLPLSCAVLDVEGGIFPEGKWVWAGMTEPQEQRWQKDVPMGNYWAYAEGVGCRPVNMLVDGIVDRASKNGVTLLDVAPKADGTLPAAQIEGLKKLGQWMSINKEALYGAKPASFVEGGVDTWRAGSIRFLEKGKYLYAIELGNVWPSTVGFAEYEKSKTPEAPYLILGVKPIEGSTLKMLGSDKSLPWHIKGNHLVIEDLPDPLPCDYAWSFKIQVKK